MSLFASQQLSRSGFRKIIYDLPDAEAILYEGFFDQQEADNLFEKIEQETKWQQDSISLYGRLHLVPRLSAWYGDSDKTYTYSGIKMHPCEWSESLLQIKKVVEEVAETTFTSVLLNYYRTGKDSMGWHQDNEKELGRDPVIASVSLGQTRPFHLRHKFRKEVAKLVVPLSHGSLLLMKGCTQHFWEHQIPKSAKPLLPRINLTFRKIVVER